MIRRNFLKAIGSFFGVAVVAKEAVSKPVSSPTKVVPVKLISGYYYNSGRIWYQIQDKVKTGETLYYGSNGRLTNKLNADTMAAAGIALSNTDPDGFCVIQLPLSLLPSKSP